MVEPFLRHITNLIFAHFVQVHVLVIIQTGMDF